MNSPATIDFTIASYPIASPVCQQMPLTLSKFDMTCPGHTRIKEVVGAGIYQLNTKGDQKDYCMLNDTFKKTPEYMLSDNFVLDK